MLAARELRYRPNLAARGLASSRSYLIALIYDNPSPSYLSNLQRGAVEACRGHGHHLVLEPMSLQDAHCDASEALLRRLSVDGVVVAPPLSDAPALRAALERLDLPFVLVAPGKAQSGRAVTIADSKAAAEMTRHLIALGHTDIAFIEGPESHTSSALRRAGFAFAMREAGLDPDIWQCPKGDFTFSSGVDAATAILSGSHDRPTAIFASNDDMAAGVMQVAARLGLSVPTDLSVCGFDDTPVARFVWPALTTVSQPIRDMGDLAVRMLIGEEDLRRQRICKVNFELVLRDSTAGPAVKAKPC